MRMAIMLSFEDRDALQEEDLAVIRGLGLSFRGRQAWPLFRSYRPGYLPARRDRWGIQLPVEDALENE